MKFLVILLLSLNLTAVAGEHQPGHPDILIQTRMDHYWTQFVIARVRHYFATTEAGDPLEKTFDDIVFEDYLFKKNAEPSMPTRALVAGLQKELQTTSNPETKTQNMLDRILASKHLSQAKIKVTIKELSYKINRASFDAQPTQKTPTDLDVDIQFSLGNILIKAAEIEIVITMPVNGADKEVIKVVMNKPWIKTPSAEVLADNAINPLDLNFNFMLQVFECDDKINFNLVKSSFAGVEKYIKEHGPKIKIAPNMTVNPNPYPLLRIGDDVWILTASEEQIQKDILEKKFVLADFLKDPHNFNMSLADIKRAKIRYVDFNKYITNHQNELKSMLLNTVVQKLEDGVGTKIQENVAAYTIKKAGWVKGGPIVSKIKVDKFYTNESHHVMVNASSALCLQEDYESKKEDCVRYTKAPRALTQDQLKKSLDLISSSINTNESDLVVSISEAFISHAMRTTVFAGLWADSFKEQHIDLHSDLNENFMLMLMDKPGHTASLFMDADYWGLEKVEQIAIHRKRMRIALNYDVLIELVKKDNVPTLTVSMIDADMSDKWIKYGAPQYGMRSEIQDIKPFNKAVIKSSREEIRAGVGTKIEIPLKSLVDFGMNEVEYVHFESDGMGRANIKLKIKDSDRIQYVKPNWRKEQLSNELKLENTIKTKPNSKRINLAK